MKAAIHPSYQQITFTCACGNSFQAGSTHAEDIRVEICSQCHPLYTGKSKLIDTAGRLERFKARLAKTEAHKEQAQTRQSAHAAKTATTQETTAE